VATRGRFRATYVTVSFGRDRCCPPRCDHWFSRSFSLQGARRPTLERVARITRTASRTIAATASVSANPAVPFLTAEAGVVAFASHESLPTRALSGALRSMMEIAQPRSRKLVA
jgi:hypothetical protein